MRKPGERFGTRCEIKNVNSIRFVQQAVEAEARRQIDLIEEGGEVKQQTRLFDPTRGETRPMRSKEEAHDYRYFPDPDLLPLELDPTWVENIKQGLPELPDVKKARFVSDYGLSPYDAGVLSADMASAAFYETVAKGRDPKIASNWLTGELFAVLNKQNLTIEQSPVSADALGGLIDLIADNTISGRIAKDVFAEMVETGKLAKDIVAAKGLQQITDTGPIEAAADQIIASSPDNVAKYKAGNEKLIGWFVGQVMKATGGKANPGVVNEILKKKLGA